ncbi:hypothetical protein niasHT_000318 [Heterodera trifolii]|uniref:Chitin-binding type-2 domain-containing protein n=1 Tax=Heterodera trifolii TaxID=157864 RepID=A0ABD2LTI1_9BILA
MSSDQNFPRTLRFPLILLLSFSKSLLDGALLANVQPRVNSIVDLHSSINQLEPTVPNYCNESKLIEQSGLIRAPMGQFLGFPCSNEFYHCRWQSDGYRTHKKNCRAGLVYDVMGTQNCNYDYNVKGCAMGPSAGREVTNCTGKDQFECPLSEDCVPLSKRCDGNYDCVLEEDEQNCPMCKPTHFPCVVSEQCIPLGQRCNGIKECQDGTDELECQNCGAGKFLCRKSGKCISAKERCDGFAHCPHGEDEQLCKKARIVLGPRMFVCESGKHQIPQQNVCDGVVHCPDDASDEKYCQVGTATETMRKMGARTMPSPNAPPNQLATPAIQLSKIAFDQPITAQQQQMEQINAGKSEPWVGTNGGMTQTDGGPSGKPPQKFSLSPANQPNKIGNVGVETFPTSNFGPMRNAMNAQQMMDISNGTNRLMVEMPRERKPTENKSMQMKTEDSSGAKTLVEGDFQAGVWNGSALQAQHQRNNPYADEWYQQRQNSGTEGRQFQQQIGQNNLIQEEGDQFKWPTFGGQLPQPQPVVITRQQQIEQRRAIKEEMGRDDRKGGAEGANTAGTDRTAQPQQTAGEEQQKAAESASAGLTATETTNEGGDQQRVTGVPLITVGLTKAEEGAKELSSQTLATVGGAEDELKKSAETKATEMVAESGKCDNDGEKTDEGTTGATEEQQKAQFGTEMPELEQTKTEQNEQQQIERDGGTERQTEKKEENDGTKANPTGEEQQLNSQLTALKGIGEMGGEQRVALNTGDDSEEQEQRAILRRLYSKYGSNARDLLQRVENLLLLAEDGISAKKSVNEPNDSGKSQKMKRRQAEEDKGLIRKYLEQLMDSETGRNKKQ